MDAKDTSPSQTARVADATKPGSTLVITLNPANAMVVPLAVRTMDGTEKPVAPPRGLDAVAPPVRTSPKKHRLPDEYFILQPGTIAIAPDHVEKAKTILTADQLAEEKLRAAANAAVDRDVELFRAEASANLVGRGPRNRKLEN